MSRVLAIIPARKGSKGIPNKNFRDLDGIRLLDRAVRCVSAAGLRGVITSDAPCDGIYDWIQRPPELAQDDTPMIDVVTHALKQVPGEPDDIILLVQPTQPLREPKHLKAAVALLEETRADSVVSVVETRSPEEILELHGGTRLKRALGWSLGDWPSRRQDMTRGFWRDGTVYAFWRSTVTQCGDIYGGDVAALIIPSEETCALDTLADWDEAERRLRARQVRPV